MRKRRWPRLLSPLDRGLPPRDEPSRHAVDSEPVTAYPAAVRLQRPGCCKQAGLAGGAMTALVCPNTSDD
jgi:hypothetical protein